HCRELPKRMVTGRTVSMGWSGRVGGDAEVISTSVLMLGASGSLINSPNGKKSSTSIKTLKEYQGWPNPDGEQIKGWKSGDWARWLADWKSKHWGEAVTVPGPKWDTLRSHSTVVVIIDDHNAVIYDKSK
ncbi:MAG: hypothetical protein ACKPKO_30785, partial [Candidatus Fonsibacter sp.]